MRLFLATVALAVFGLPAHAATPAQQAELKRLERRAQSLAIAFSAATTKDNVLHTLGARYWAVSQPCSSDCTQSFFIDGGKTTPYVAHLYRYSSRMNSDNYHYDRPFEAESGFVEVWLVDKNPPDMCFSVDGWNTVLKAAGWPPLTRGTRTRIVRVSADPRAVEDGDFEAAEKREVTVTVWESRLGNKQIGLSTAPDIYDRSFITTKTLEAAQALGDCARLVTTEVE